MTEGADIGTAEACELINEYGIEDIVHFPACEEIRLHNGMKLNIWFPSEYGELRWECIQR